MEGYKRKFLFNPSEPQRSWVLGWLVEYGETFLFSSTYHGTRFYRQAVEIIGKTICFDSE
jgi:hypothetical protein